MKDPEIVLPTAKGEKKQELSFRGVYLIWGPGYKINDQVSYLWYAGSHEDKTDFDQRFRELLLGSKHPFAWNILWNPRVYRRYFSEDVEKKYLNDWVRSRESYFDDPKNRRKSQNWSYFEQSWAGKGRIGDQFRATVLKVKSKAESAQLYLEGSAIYAHSIRYGATPLLNSNTAGVGGDFFKYGDQENHRQEIGFISDNWRFLQRRSNTPSLRKWGQALKVRKWA